MTIYEYFLNQASKEQRLHVHRELHNTVFAGMVHGTLKHHNTLVDDCVELLMLKTMNLWELISPEEVSDVTNCARQHLEHILPIIAEFAVQFRTTKIKRYIQFICTTHLLSWDGKNFFPSNK